uniref:Uncharacterized protein n=1 Tax=Candidatus Kentrum sp. UNK TaxID=2126344 RepID=A0A451AS03_9GAMM|nr:MAG: hypothetical protein BECKUNK1418G_GA0071005_10082 [Candidatus Kentron sp. UNK]VFK68836.1 MAG: hypothetical protein BECKUNK1418H_GA0071006_100653 [Candidatus Kentron sp. UNK]
MRHTGSHFCGGIFVKVDLDLGDPSFAHFEVVAGNKQGSSEKFVGNFLGSLALYSSVHTGMTKVVLSVIFV